MRPTIPSSAVNAGEVATTTSKAMKTLSADTTIPISAEPSVNTSYTQNANNKCKATLIRRLYPEKTVYVDMFINS